MSITKLTDKFLDSLFSKTKSVASKVNEVVDTLNLQTDGTLSVDTISETTVSAGVTVDSVLLKDGGVELTKGTVTQLTAITTGVTVNTPAGVITTVSSTLAAGSNAAFTVTNSFCKAASVVQLTVDDSATAGIAKLNVQTVSAGSFVVNITNIHGSLAFNNILKIHFTIL